MSLDAFIEKIGCKDAIIGILGMGYVGLPLALRFAEAGYQVVGFDIDQKKVDLINRGQSFIEHIPSEDLAKALDGGLEATTDFSRSSDADALIICVPTPLNKYREPDLSFVSATLNSLKPHLRAGHLVSLESTTYPGTTEEELLPVIGSTGLVPGEDVFVVYSPEREDPGNGKFNTKTIPKVVGGHTPNCLAAGLKLYDVAIEKTVPVSSTKVAEMTKLLENIHRSVNIGLVNEMKVVADRMGIDIFEVIDAAATKPFGFTPYYPGPGLGGHCIPVDPFYLTWKAREFGLHTRFIELSGEINKAMPNYVISKLIIALNKVGKSLNGAKVLVLGIAYKRDVDDVRESPSIDIMELLLDYDVNVSYSDPHVPSFPPMRDHSFDLTSVSPTPESLASFDAVILATDHSSFDYHLIHEHANIIVDTRGKYRVSDDKVTKA